LGPIGFWEGFLDTGVLQHRLATTLAFALGLLKWRARTSTATNPRLRYLFPVLSVLGSVLLLTHSHSAFELKSDFLKQVSHTALGVLAVLVACGRWLELRLPQQAEYAAGLAANVALLLIGALLAFYREPLH
ncbi:MAG TPA: hypothetical protein VF982_09825, partial [Anaerolineales bacterium]